MSYVKINGSSKHYNETYLPFTTQHGYEAVRFIGDELPETDKGFKVYDDDDKVILDLTKYKYFHRPNEYSVEPDEIEPPAPNNEITHGSNPLTGIYAKIDQINSEVKDITPYTESKKVYIGDTECVFDTAKEGSINAWLTTSEARIPCNYDVVEGKIVVSFDELEEVGTVTINIQ